MVSDAGKFRMNRDTAATVIQYHAERALDRMRSHWLRKAETRASTSEPLLPTPKLTRITLRASSGEKPITSKTKQRTVLPAAQAEPLDTAMPASSRFISR